MTLSKNAQRWIVVVAMGAVVTACGGSKPSPTAPTPVATVTSVTVTSAGTAGTTFQLTATARLSDGSTQDVTGAATWASSDIKTATVSSTGFVTVTGGGEVEIQAAYQGVADSAHLFVTPQKMYALSGVVRSAGPGGQPMAGAQVRVLESSVSGNPTLTDANGAFTFSALAPGRHLVEVSKAGYELWETSILIVDRGLQIAVTLDAR